MIMLYGPKKILLSIPRLCFNATARLLFEHDMCQFFVVDIEIQSLSVNIILMLQLY